MLGCISSLCLLACCLCSGDGFRIVAPASEDGSAGNEAEQPRLAAEALSAIRGSKRKLQYLELEAEKKLEQELPSVRDAMRRALGPHGSKAKLPKSSLGPWRDLEKDIKAYAIVYDDTQLGDAAPLGFRDEARREAFKAVNRLALRGADWIKILQDIKALVKIYDGSVLDNITPRDFRDEVRRRAFKVVAAPALRDSDWKQLEQDINSYVKIHVGGEELDGMTPPGFEDKSRQMAFKAMTEEIVRITNCTQIKQDIKAYVRLFKAREAYMRRLDKEERSSSSSPSSSMWEGEGPSVQLLTRIKVQRK